MVERFPLTGILALLGALWAGMAAAEQQRAAYTEFPEQNAALVAATVAFFERVEGEDAKPRRRIPIIGLPLRATRSSAPDTNATVLTRMGPVRHLTGYNITWYPTDRLLGTVDFMGTWDGNRNLVCGYLTWDLTDPNAPKLETVSANFVSLETLKRTGAGEAERVLLNANCAYGSIDENYAFFEVTG